MFIYRPAKFDSVTRQQDNSIVILVIWLCIGLIVAIFLDMTVNIQTCDYDACRYVRNYQFEIPTDSITEILLSYGTSFMHIFYGTIKIEGLEFASAYLKNLVIFMASCGILKSAIRYIQFPLMLAFIILPGKEFFIVMGALYFVYAMQSRNWPQLLFLLAISIAFIAISRPAFVILMPMSYIFWMLISQRRYWVFAALVISIAASTSILARALGIEELVQKLAEAGSSIESAQAIKTFTFGYNVQAIFGRIIIYIGYLFAAPLIEIFRICKEVVTIGIFPFHLYMISLVAQVLLFEKSRPFQFLCACIVAAAAIAIIHPFIHTRYLLPIILLCIFRTSFDSNKKYPR
jgi:hypothetical protein